MMIVTRASGRGSWLGLIARADADDDEGGLMVAAWASNRGSWLGFIVRADADEHEGNLL